MSREGSCPSSQHARWRPQTVEPAGDCLSRSNTHQAQTWTRRRQLHPAWTIPHLVLSCGPDAQVSVQVRRQRGGDHTRQRSPTTQRGTIHPPQPRRSAQSARWLPLCNESCPIHKTRGAILKQACRHSIAVASVLVGQFDDVVGQTIFVCTTLRYLALRGSMLAESASGTAFVVHWARTNGATMDNRRDPATPRRRREGLRSSPVPPPPG